jgi:hypothetical protein
MPKPVALSAILLSIVLLIINTSNVKINGLEPKSHPFKVVISLNYIHDHFLDAIDKVAISYEDSDGFKHIEYYDIDKMINQDPSKPIKVNAIFPKNTITDYEDYLICVTNLNNNQKNCDGDSRSPESDEEKIHIQIP